MLVLFSRRQYNISNMYFASRAAAGQQLADDIVKRHAGEPCTIVALSSGAVEVALQIGLRLNSPIAMLLTEEITLPNETTAIGGMTSNGVFEYNHSFSKYQLEEFIMEYHGVIEQSKLEQLRKLHREVISEDLITPELLTDRNVILVSDGLQGGFVLELAVSYLKPIRHRKLIMATPFADVYAVDRMHLLADELHCFNVLENYISTDHYYDDNSAPSRQEATEIITNVLKQWYESEEHAQQKEIVAAQPSERVYAKDLHHPRLRSSIRLMAR